ncbi:unnamed protein product, partial [Ectocarpus sp. 13 AM-2016]
EGHGVHLVVLEDPHRGGPSAPVADDRRSGAGGLRKRYLLHGEVRVDGPFLQRHPEHAGHVGRQRHIPLGVCGNPYDTVVVASLTRRHRLKRAVCGGGEQGHRLGESGGGGGGGGPGGLRTGPAVPGPRRGRQVQVVEGHELPDGEVPLLLAGRHVERADRVVVPADPDHVIVTAAPRQQPAVALEAVRRVPGQDLADLAGARVDAEDPGHLGARVEYPLRIEKRRLLHEEPGLEARLPEALGRVHQYGSVQCRDEPLLLVEGPGQLLVGLHQRLSRVEGPSQAPRGRVQGVHLPVDSPGDQEG